MKEEEEEMHESELQHLSTQSVKTLTQILTESRYKGKKGEEEQTCT